MPEADIHAEYSAAKDNYEQAKTALAVASARLSDAAKAMCQSFNRHYEKIDGRAVARDRKLTGGKNSERDD